MSYYAATGDDPIVFYGSTKGGTMTSTGVKDGNSGFWGSLLKGFNTPASTDALNKLAGGSSAGGSSAGGSSAGGAVVPAGGSSNMLLIGGGVAVGALVLVLLLKK